MEAGAVIVSRKGDDTAIEKAETLAKELNCGLPTLKDILEQ